MNFIKIKFYNNFEDEFQKTVDEVFHMVSPVLRNNECIWMPHVDIYESQEEIIVIADIAGIDKDELHIELTRKKIKIAGVRKMISVINNARYCLAEIPHGYFVRNIILPSMVDAESAIARYADGILMIRINKISDPKAHRLNVTTNE